MSIKKDPNTLEKTNTISKNKKTISGSGAECESFIDKKNIQYLDKCLSFLNETPFYKNDTQAIVKGDITSLISSKTFVDLIVTSPPYNLDINYNSNNDKLEYKEYLDFTFTWLKACYKISKNDGRLCLNIPLDKNKGGMQSIYADITSIAKKAGWNYFTTIIWNEGNISRRTAWGSWKSASAPYVIAPVEMIAIFYKKQWKKLEKGISTIERQEFLDWSNGLWTFNGESKKRIGHPAPFPLELPDRCIKLFSYEGDVVFDPFLGSGTTLIAANNNNRFSFGLDIDELYCELAKNRIIKNNKGVSNDAKSERIDTVVLQKKSKKRHTSQGGS